MKTDTKMLKIIDDACVLDQKEDKMRSLMADNITKLEMEFEKGARDKLLIKILSRLYQELNLRLGVICNKLNYPLNQWEWKDSLPMEYISRIYSIGDTDWYQRQLGMILQPQDHPWYRVIFDSAIVAKRHKESNKEVA